MEEENKKGYLVKLLIVAVSVLFLGILILFYFWWQIDHSRGELEIGAVEFTIEPGSNILEIGETLEKNGLIASKFYFVAHILKENLRGKINADEYSIDAGLTIPEIVFLMIESSQKGDEQDLQKKLTFPEGWDAKKIYNRLEANGLNVDDFMELFENPMYFSEKYGYEFLNDAPNGATLEGFLFPDTYFFLNDATSEEIIKKMLDNFDQKFSDDLRNDVVGQGKTIFEIITMASLIEREVISEEDMKVVGGIFWDRIKYGQALQSCATLAYILGESKEQYTYEDTQIESLYNTYLYPGLPPGPIANPGISSIMAAIYPTYTDYNYFLTSQKTGETIFSKTLEEHNLNKVKHGL